MNLFTIYPLPFASSLDMSTGPGLMAYKLLIFIFSLVALLLVFNHRGLPTPVAADYHVSPAFHR